MASLTFSPPLSLSLSLSFSLFLFLTIYLSVCGSIHVSVCLSVRRSFSEPGFVRSSLGELCLQKTMFLLFILTLFSFSLSVSPPFRRPCFSLDVHCPIFPSLLLLLFVDDVVVVVFQCRLVSPSMEAHFHPLCVHCSLPCLCLLYLMEELFPHFSSPPCPP